MTDEQHMFLRETTSSCETRESARAHSTRSPRSRARWRARTRACTTGASATRTACLSLEGELHGVPENTAKTRDAAANERNQALDDGFPVAREVILAHGAVARAQRRRACRHNGLLHAGGRTALRPAPCVLLWPLRRPPLAPLAPLAACGARHPRRPTRPRGGTAVARLRRARAPRARRGRCRAHAPRARAPAPAGNGPPNRLCRPAPNHFLNGTSKHTLKLGSRLPRWCDIG